MEKECIYNDKEFDKELEQLIRLSIMQMVEKEQEEIKPDESTFRRIKELTLEGR